ncbi:hypothetical protein [Methylocapsa aurea]|uniref:hypothetical protein n=1 Tax=Methylocapsa aurea TaxID=663610 RepID=UPI00055C68A8|nr:hypothetical protein [Methylocapsa aurea]
MFVLNRIAAGAIFASLSCGICMAGDLTALRQWTGKYPADKIVAGKSLWEQPGVAAAMRAAMGAQYFALSRKIMHGPEGPVADNGKGAVAAWSCKAHDCGDNQMSVFFDLGAGSAQVCWRAADRSGKVQDLWLAGGKARPLASNACLSQGDDPFATLKKFGGAG